MGCVECGSASRRRRGEEDLVATTPRSNVRRTAVSPSLRVTDSHGEVMWVGDLTSGDLYL